MEAVWIIDPKPEHLEIREKDQDSVPWYTVNFALSRYNDSGLKFLASSYFLA